MEAGETLIIMVEETIRPLWLGRPDADGWENVDPEDLPLMSETVERVKAWAAAYRATLDDGFASATELLEFRREGKLIFNQIKSELQPRYEVVLGRLPDRTRRG